MSTYTNQLVDIRSACPACINLNQLLEDTFILLDALEEDADALNPALTEGIDVLETPAFLTGDFTTIPEDQYEAGTSAFTNTEVMNILIVMSQSNAKRMD